MDSLVRAISRYMAFLGGIVLVALTILTTVSISGRLINTFAHSDWMKNGFPSFSEFLINAGIGPVPGDFELVECGIALAIFSFLPWCQLTRGHATVDLFTSMLSNRTNRIIDLIAEIIMSVILVLLAWRMWIGMTDKLRYGETTFILQFPVWWSYLASELAAIVAAAVSIYLIWVRYRELRTGLPVFHDGQGAVH